MKKKYCNDEINVQELKKKFNQLTLESEDRWDYQGKGKSERDYVHGFCTYPAMMVPKMQREILEVCLERIKKKKIRLLDPFAGSGTILVEGMLKGLDIVGIDINPLAVLLCKVKTTIIEPEELKNKANLLEQTVEQLKEQNVKKHFFEGIDKWFTERAIDDLSIIRAAIMQEARIEIRRFFWATFCEVVRIVSNSRDCTYKLHIKEAKDIDGYNKDALNIFSKTLKYNIEQYILFYTTLKENGKIKEDGVTYKGEIKVVLGDSVSYLNHSKQKYDLVVTSPPYGDNHTTVSYGQYSVMPLRWIECTDIDATFERSLIDTLCGIDNVSLGGKYTNKSMSSKRKKVLDKSETLKHQSLDIQKLDEKQVNKLIAFYSDFDLFLSAVSKKMKQGAVSVWTLGNRKIAKQEIYMNKITMELCSKHQMLLVTSFTRKILNKRMPEISAYSGEYKESQTTMTREHILVFAKEV